MTKWHEKTDWDRKFLDRIPGFSGFTGFYLKDRKNFAVFWPILCVFGQKK
jgi:hypothetical protein